MLGYRDRTSEPLVFHVGRNQESRLRLLSAVRDPGSDCQTSDQEPFREKKHAFIATSVSIFVSVEPADDSFAFFVAIPLLNRTTPK